MIPFVPLTAAIGRGGRAAVEYENLSLACLARDDAAEVTPRDGSRKTVRTVSGTRGTIGRSPCNINPFNKLIIDEIYRAFTVRGGANALHLYPGGTPAILAARHPCGLIYGRALTSLGPHQPRGEKVVQDDAAALGRYGYDAARGSWASLKIYPSGWRRGE